MGGLGSGTWYRGSKRLTTDRVKRIDIRYMKKQGLLVPGKVGTLSWKVGEESIGTISYYIHQDYMQLSFRYQKGYEGWKSIEQGVDFDKTACNFGGERIWYLCPCCNRRVAVLYGVQEYFLCRHCYQLSYSSQNDTEMDKLISQMNKLGEHIFARYEGGEGWGKKKGMHWKTFRRLHIQYANYEKQLKKALLYRSVDLNEIEFI